MTTTNMKSDIVRKALIRLQDEETATGRTPGRHAKISVLNADSIDRTAGHTHERDDSAGYELARKVLRGEA